MEAPLAGLARSVTSCGGFSRADRHQCPDSEPAAANDLRDGEVEYHFRPDGRVWLVYTEDAHGNPQVLGRLPEE